MYLTAMKREGGLKYLVTIITEQGMNGGLKIGGICQEWMGMCPKVAVFE